MCRKIIQDINLGFNRTLFSGFRSGRDYFLLEVVMNCKMIHSLASLLLPFGAQHLLEFTAAPRAPRDEASNFICASQLTL
jgi:hypothetical protein